VRFLGIHDGFDACFVLRDWWADENGLHHHMFIATADDRGALGECTGAAFIACVWDLVVICREP